VQTIPIRAPIAALVWLVMIQMACAETLTATIIKSGLLGSWAIDCSLHPDRDKGAVLTYEVKPDGRVIYQRNFGDAKDENEVISASTNADGLLNITVFFPSLHQTREFGLQLQEDGSLRAIYNRGERGDYTIKDGRFVRTGEPTPGQHRCGNTT
jgi:hypothetical protein